MATKEQGAKHALYIYTEDEEDYSGNYDKLCQAYFSINMWEYITDLDPVFGDDDGTWEIDAYVAKDLIAMAKEDLADETKEITISALKKVVAYYRRKTRKGIVVYTNEL